MKPAIATLKQQDPTRIANDMEQPLTALGDYGWIILKLVEGDGISGDLRGCLQRVAYDIIDRSSALAKQAQAIQGIS